LAADEGSIYLMPVPKMGVVTAVADRPDGSTPVPI